MSQSNLHPSVGDLWDKYSYNPFTGTLHRRDSDRPLGGCRNKKCHQIAFYTSRHPYGVVVFAWMQGRWPIQGMDIYHIDRNPFNQRWHNLREVTRRQNMQNTKLFRGGTAKTRTGDWSAYITIGGQKTYLGQYDTQKEAQAAYLAACVSHGLTYLPELARGL